MSRLAVQSLKCSRAIVRRHLTSCFPRGIYFFSRSVSSKKRNLAFSYGAVFSLPFLNF